MGATDVPDARVDSGCQWFTAADPLLTKPGNAAYATCLISVPFAHCLRKATMGFTDIAVVGTIKAELMVADDGDAKAGTEIAELATTTLVDSTDTAQIYDFTLATADKEEVAAARNYWVVITGTNAGDLLAQMALSICVQPLTRSRL